MIFPAICIREYFLQIQIEPTYLAKLFRFWDLTLKLISFFNLNMPSY